MHWLAAIALGAITGVNPLPKYYDAHLIVAPDLWVVAGSTLTMRWENLVLDDNGAQVYTFTSNYGTVGASTWTFSDSTVGSYSLTLSARGSTWHDSTTATVRVVANTIAATKIVLLGDSIFDNQTFTSTVCAKTKALLPTATFLGTRTNGSCANEGWQGQSLSWFATNAASPITDAGGALDIASWVTAIGATPDLIVIEAGINDFLGFAWTSEDSYKATYVIPAVANIRLMLDAFHAAIPGVIVAIMLIESGWGSDSGWTGGSNAYAWEQRKSVYNREIVGTFGHAQAQGVYVLDAVNNLNRASDYADQVHHTAAGDQPMADAIAAFAIGVR